ncbi:MAG TPA: hypothetical protein VH008_07810 [Pseudonocardia sp.]|nr:hypothetical protein [Pseudonocardia sp.]
MNRNWGRKAGFVTTVVAVGTAVSALLGGVAMAACDDHGDGGHEHGSYSASGGNGGNGADANANCAVPIGASVGLLGQGGDNSQCNATGGGGGDGGTGANY